MAVTIFSTGAESFEDPVQFLLDVSERPSDDVRVWPYPIQGGVRAQYLQKCRDTSTGIWNFWATYYQDIYGNEYPGTSFDSGTYRVVCIVYDREQI